MMGEMNARNMWSNLAVNKYLHIAASRWISSINKAGILTPQTRICSYSFLTQM
jgi:hypothetical protein